MARTKAMAREIDGYDDDWAGWCTACGEPCRVSVPVYSSFIPGGPAYWGSACCFARLTETKNKEEQSDEV